MPGADKEDDQSKEKKSSVLLGRRRSKKKKSAASDNWVKKRLKLPAGGRGTNLTPSFQLLTGEKPENILPNLQRVTDGS